MTIEDLPLKPVRLDETVAYHCSRCGECCRHVAHSIMLESLDAYRLARHFGKSMREIYETYTNPSMLDESGFPIFLLNTVGKDDVCVFLKDNRCTVQNVKPRTCRLYPFTAGPCDNYNFSYFLCMEKAHHFSGAPIHVESWLDESFDAQAQAYIHAEYEFVPKLGKMFCSLPSNQRAEAIFFMEQFRYFHFSTKQPFFKQYLKNNQHLIWALHELASREKGDKTV